MLTNITDDSLDADDMLLMMETILYKSFVNKTESLAVFLSQVHNRSNPCCGQILLFADGCFLCPLTIELCKNWITCVLDHNFIINQTGFYEF